MRMKAKTLHFGTRSSMGVPNYWSVEYITGWRVPPGDIKDYLLKQAAIAVLNILGDITFGAGIASKSISADGLSETINTTQSAENSLYSARIRQFERENKEEIKILRGKYKGIVLGVL